MATHTDSSSPPIGAPRAASNIELVIFDCDGVLIDSEPIASRTLAETLVDAGVPISASEAHERFTGFSEQDIKTMCERDYGLSDVDRVFEDWHQRLYAEFGRTLTAMPGIAEVVAGVHVPKCVASNSTMTRLERSLGHLDLWHAFDHKIFSAEAVLRPKPAPDLMLYCAEQLGVTPARCVMIDDSPHGIAAAVAAGMLAIGCVDLNDPRPNRKSLLSDAGAFAVAMGASELPAILRQADAALEATSAFEQGAMS